jgi:hypothetical protein
MQTASQRTSLNHPRSSSVLFVIASDPRFSARPAEAVRIAAGVAAWKRKGLRVHFHNAGVLALSELTDTFVDEDHYSRYLPLLADLNERITVTRSEITLDQLGNPRLPYTQINPAELAALCAEVDYVARF